MVSPKIPSPFTAPLPPVVGHCGSGCLFDLADDPLEARDLASSLPQRVATMRTRLEALLPSAFNPLRGSVDPAACDVALGR